MSTTSPRKDLAPEQVRTALATGPRPAPPGPVRAWGGFLWRSLLKIKHLPEQMFDVTILPIIFLLMFTYLFGGALADSPDQYLQELLPGILAMTVVMTTMYTALTLNRDIHTGVYDRFRGLPIWRPSVLIGPLLADAVRYLLASTMIMLLGVALGFRPNAGAAGVLAAIAVLIGFSFALSWI